MCWRKAFVAAATLALAGCGQGVDAPEPAIPDESLTQSPQPAVSVYLTETVSDTRELLLRYAAQGSLTRLARLADQSDGFISNFNGQPHQEFWDLLRRTGLDPNLKLRELLDQSPGVRMVDGERWYVLSLIHI